MNINQTNKETYGKIIKGSILREHVGDGTTPNGKKFELALELAQCSPIVICENRIFVLSWNEICNMANAAGLFENKEVQND